MNSTFCRRGPGMRSVCAAESLGGQAMAGVTFRLTILWVAVAYAGCTAAPARTNDPPAAVVSRAPSPVSLVVETGEPGRSEALPATSAPDPPIPAQTSDRPTDPVADTRSEPPTEPPSPSSDPGTGCLQYEPQQVILRGVIRRVTFPGPPNYESVARGDAPETCWLLELDQPACVDASASNELYIGHSRVRRVQLVLEGEDYKRFRHLVGQRIDALGELFGAHTGHHHTEILLTVGELRSVSRRRE